MIDTLLSLAFLAQVLRIAVPYAFAALGGSITERSGIIDLAIEAKLLFGAFAAAAVGHGTGSAVAGIAAGMLAGMAVAALQVLCSVWLGANQVIVGIALNLLALGGTRFLLQLIFHEGANSPPAPSYGDAVLGNPLIWGAVLASLLIPLAVMRTRWGLRLRAAGDRPDALLAVGVAPGRARMHAALVGGLLSGAGGAQLSLVVGGFSADMSSGRGYIALTMVILSGWRPALAVVGCLVVALSEAIRIQLAGAWIPHELAPQLPFMLTLVVLMIAGGKGRQPPAALGK